MIPTPTLNVNLKPCRCQQPKTRAAPCEPGHHRPECGGPVLIPCPIPPKVEFTAWLGECDCGNVVASGLRMPGHHRVSCPARPIHVVCSIGGDGTWAGSEVVEMEILVSPMSIDERNRIYAACRDLWALVKALVLGRDVPPGSVAPGTIDQRDAVFAALCVMVRAEKDGLAAVLRLPEWCRPGVASLQVSEALQRYVSHLIASIGDLS